MENKIDYHKRRMLAKAFMNSEFYKLFVEPDMKDCIDKCKMLSSIKEDDIEKSYYRAKNKKDVYQGLINKWNSWIVKNYKDEEVKKDGGN